MQLKVTDSTHKKLKEISRKLEMPMSQVINMFCIQWLKDNSTHTANN